jgi:outer membrane murein-binding lipoprotein Lpp
MEASFLMRRVRRWLAGAAVLASTLLAGPVAAQMTLTLYAG